MPEFCSCGAQLVPDSLFCHKCGKPQREVVEPEPETITDAIPVAPPAPPPAPSPASLPLNFHNPVAVRVAVRVAFSVALIATLLSWIPAMNILLWAAAGWVAVYLYRRATGALLSVRAGVRMGWITGVLMFAITTVIFTLTVIPTAANGGLTTLMRQQLKNASDPNVQEALRLLETGPGIATILITLLFMLFCFITLLSMAGGALGAKMVGSKQ